MKSKVYFTNQITSESLVKIYEQVGKELKGNVAIKISTGEPGGHNFLNPNLIKKNGYWDFYAIVFIETRVIL